jgi:hypothetical protein
MTTESKEAATGAPPVGISAWLAGVEQQICADDARVACPLFQEEYGGSKPTSALHLKIERIHLRLALKLNKQWHSRLPDLPFDTVNMKHGIGYGAICHNIYYAIAIWSTPVAMQLDDGETVELRRMAIADDAPKNTASRMLAIMVRDLKKREPHYIKAISYQDTEVHAGTIYKAAGWKNAHTNNGKPGWHGNGKIYGKRMASGNAIVSNAPKTRWELALREPAND